MHVVGVRVLQFVGQFSSKNLGIYLPTSCKTPTPTSCTTPLCTQPPGTWACTALANLCQGTPCCTGMVSVTFQAQVLCLLPP